VILKIEIIMKNQTNHTNQKNQDLSRPSGSSDNLKPFYNTTIPSDWEIKELRKEIEELEAGVSVNSVDDESFVDDFFILKTSAVSDGLFFPNECKKILLRDIERAKLNPRRNSIIISRMNTPALVGECGYVEETYQNLFLPDRLWQTKLKKNSKINVKWLNYILNTPDYKLKIKNSATGTSNSMKNISKEVFLSLKIPFPPLPEQRAIASLLFTWDETIAKHNQLIVQKELRKKWLMQNLLTGKKRLKGFEGEWKIYHLSDMFTERNETRYYDLPLLSVGANGIYPQSDSIKKDTSNEDKSKYKRICPGDIGYNTMRMWQGRSALSQLEGIVSPAYTIVKPKKNADSLVFSYLFKMPKLTNLFLRNSQGLVDDTLNCKFKDFAIIKVSLPNTKEEQTAIAAVLQTADKEIQLLKMKSEKLKEQKKGLMQLLLTGKKRLKYE